MRAKTRNPRAEGRKKAEIRNPNLATLKLNKTEGNRGIRGIRGNQIKKGSVFAYCAYSAVYKFQRFCMKSENADPKGLSSVSVAAGGIARISPGNDRLSSSLVLAAAPQHSAVWHQLRSPNTRQRRWACPAGTGPEPYRQPLRYCARESHWE